MGMADREVGDLAQTFAAHGDRAQVVALEARQQAFLEREPMTADIRESFVCELAVAYALLGEADEAAQRIPKQDGASRSNCLFMLVDTLLGAGLLEPAIPYAEELLAVRVPANPIGFVETLVVVAKWQSASGRSDAALRTLRRAEKLAPDKELEQIRHAQLIQIAQALLALGAAEQALRVANAAAPEDDESYLMDVSELERRQILARFGDSAKAVTMVERLVDWADNDADPITAARAASWYSQLGMRERATRQLARARQLYAATEVEPDHRESYQHNVADVSFYLGDIPEVLQLVRQMESGGLRSAFLTRLAGYVLEHDVEPSAAIDDALDALPK